MIIPISEELTGIQGVKEPVAPSIVLAGGDDTVIRLIVLKRSCQVLLCVVCAMALGLGAARMVNAADPTFVGVLALALDKEVSDRLGLSEEVRGRLQRLVNEREDEALEIVLRIKDLPPTLQIARLTPFVEESERLGLALLTLAQKEKLAQIRLARESMNALAEPYVAESLGLSSEQRQGVQRLLEQRDTELTKGGENERRITRLVYERKLAAVLSESQRATWQTLAGLSDAPLQTPNATAGEQPVEQLSEAETVEAEQPAIPPPAAETSEEHTTEHPSR